MSLCRFEQCFLLSSRKRAHLWWEEASARDSAADISGLLLRHVEVILGYFAGTSRKSFQRGLQ